MGNLPNGGGIAGGQRRQRSLLGRLAEQYSPTRSATLLVLPLLLSHASPRRRTLWRQPVGAGSTARSPAYARSPRRYSARGSRPKASRFAQVVWQARNSAAPSATGARMAKPASRNPRQIALPASSRRQPIS